MVPLFRASRLGMTKDVIVLVLVAAFLVVMLTSIFPPIFSAQLEAVEGRFLQDQEETVRRAVDEAARQLVTLDARLAAEGIPGPNRDSILQSALSARRFGVGASGYFFLFTQGGTLLVHPTQPELVGRSLRTVVSPDGTNLETLFFGALGQGPTARVEYLWNPLGKTVPESKTTFLRTIEGKGWVVGSGFYRSDFQPTRDAFLASSQKALSESRLLTLTMASALTVLGLILSALIFFRVRATERDLDRRTAGLEQYKRLLDKSSMVSRTTPQGIITAVNDTFCEVTGYRRADVVGLSHNVERHPDTPLEVFRDLWSTISQGKVWQGTLKNRRANGTSYLKRATIVPILDEKGRIVEYLSSGQDVTEVFENRTKLQRAFMTDPLTGLGNRTRLLADLDSMTRPGVLLVDAVGFSGINGVFGQDAGDLVLQALAKALFEAADWNPTVYRVHSDTFALVAPRQDPGTFARLVRTTADRLASFSVDLGGRSIPVGLRFGAACTDGDTLVYADEALAGSRSGRSRVVVHEVSEEGPGAELQHRLQVLQTLRWALDQNKVFPVFQPILNLSTGRVEKYECLMRVENAEGRTLLPGEFMEISKKTHVYQALSHRLFHLGLEAARAQDLEVSVNLTMEDFLSPDTVEYLVAEARRTGMAHRLIVEFVETEELEDLDRTEKVLAVLRAEGIRLAIDDFGSGYASFDYLLKLNPAFVKIDGSIIQKLTTDQRAGELVSSIVGFARKAGMKTVAEFLDTPELVERVRALGVDYGQGWHIGKAERLP